MSFETTAWPFVQAKWFVDMSGKPRRTVNEIVIHTMEFHERGDTAEVIAHDFATRPANNKGSAHICVDNNTIVQCVRDKDIAYAAPGCNNDGIQVELAGYGNQSRDQWLDEFSMALLQLGGDAVAQYCMKYEIPAVHLTNDELRAHKKGIIGHYQASQVYKQSDHMDPGPNFPWDIFIAIVQARLVCYQDGTA